MQLLDRQPQRKFRLLPEPCHRRIQESDPAQLLVWAERVPTAERLDELSP